MNQKDLTEALENGTFKWKYTDNSVNKPEMYNYIISNEIKLNGCWRITEDSIFRKIRSGLQVERSPPQTQPALSERRERVKKTSCNTNRQNK